MGQDIYEQLKQIMRDKTDAVAIDELDNLDETVSKLNTDEDVLKDAFDKVITARDDLFTEVEKLVEERNEVYQTAITVMYLSYFFNKINYAVENNITIWYTLLQFSRSEEFTNVLKNLKLYVTDTDNMTAARTAQFQTYFIEQFNTMKTLTGRTTITMVNTTNGPVLQEDSISIDPDDPDQADNYIFYTLGYLAYANTTFFTFSYIMEIINVIEYSKRNLALATFKEFNIEIANVKKSLKQFMILDTYRKENDPSYTGTYTQDLYDNIELYDFYLSRFSGINQKSMEALKEEGIFSLLFLTLIDINSKIDTLAYDTIRSIETINGFLENYSMFVKLPEDSIAEIETTITSVLVNYVEKLSDDTDKEYFNEALINQPNLDTFVTDISALLSVNDEPALFFEDYYNLVILYTGVILKNHGRAYDLNYINYAVKNLVTKVEVNPVEINNTTFTDLKTTEEALADEYGIHIIDIVNNELIDPTLKILYPKLGIIDIVDINLLVEHNIGYTDAYWLSQGESEYYNLTTDAWRVYTTSWNNGTMPVNLAELINICYLSILESMLDNRAVINETFIKTLSTYTKRGYNFKSVFVEMMIRKAFKTIIDYVDGLTTTTILDFSTKNSITNYVNDSTINNANEKILYDYKTVRTAFYSAEENLIPVVLNLLPDDTQYYDIENGLLFTYDLATNTWDAGVAVADTGLIQYTKPDAIRIFLEEFYT